jgi:hypothetical protein
MVGAIKKWLGIDLLEGDVRALQGANAARVEEILIMAKTLLEHTTRIEELETRPIAENSLTSEPAEKKIVPKPRPVNWKNFRSAVEKASNPQEDS